LFSHAAVSHTRLTPGNFQASIVLSPVSMPDTLQIETTDQPQPKTGRSWIAWMGAATVAIALAIVMWPGAERRPLSRTRESHLPFGSAEQAYAPTLQIENLALSRAENFLNQEVTTLAGSLTNAGNLPLTNVELTVEFSVCSRRTPRLRSLLRAHPFFLEHSAAPRPRLRYPVYF